MTAHTMGLAALVGACWVLDLRLLGVGRTTPLSAYGWVFPVVNLGLAVNLITGVLLFVKNATTWGTAMPFLIKMVLVVASVATIVPIRRFVLAAGADQIEVSDQARRLAIASIVLWAAAVTAGRLLAYTVV